MKVGLMTREWPPEIYGGAGVHVEQLAKHLRSYADVSVQCFGEPRPDAQAFEPPTELEDDNFSLQAIGVNLEMADAARGLGCFDVCSGRGGLAWPSPPAHAPRRSRTKRRGGMRSTK